MSADHYIELIHRYRNKGALIDANLLLVYFIGCYDPLLISRFKRTLAFTIEDFDIVHRAFRFFAKVVTTPNIVTEVSNLSNQLPESVRRDYYVKMAEQIADLEEHYLESRKVCSLEHFKNLGLTDSGIIALVKGNYLVLTDDFRLSGYLAKAGIDAINFNHLRIANWGA